MVAKLGWEPRWYDPALASWLHRIDVPTQVLWGREDKLFPSAYAQEWAAHVPGCKVHILPEAGHLLHVEKSEDVASRIIAFAGGR
jgi:pimeloyl-ACP methyl ester carboxylesterase